MRSGQLTGSRLLGEFALATEIFEIRALGLKWMACVTHHLESSAAIWPAATQKQRIVGARRVLQASLDDW